MSNPSIYGDKVQIIKVRYSELIIIPLKIFSVFLYKIVNIKLEK